MLSQHMALSNLAIIGDIHSNALALKAALRSIADYEKTYSSIDIIVFVGDLLTYGVRPHETLCELHRILSLRPSAFVLGNHDQMYLDLLIKSSSDYYNKMPSWIKESVNYNLMNIDPGLFLDIEFSPWFVRDDVLVSHANFSSVDSDIVDWSYVNTVDDHLDQLLVLSGFRSRLGVLGHTHRTRCFSLAPSGIASRPWDCVDRGVKPDSPIDLFGYPCSLINAGSIGQPRERGYSNPAWLLVEFDDSFASTATLVSFTYDVAIHLNDLFRSELSSSCVQKLCTYFR